MERSGIAVRCSGLLGLLAHSRMNGLKNFVLLKNQHRVVDMHAGAVFTDSGLFQFISVIPVVHIIYQIHRKSEEIVFRSIPSAESFPVGGV